MKISIALCTYNGENFLEEQLLSYCNQERLPDELVVCDDGSTDSTKNILNKFSEKAPFKTEIVFNQKNLGLVKNFEKAISLCRGDIICPSDQDDVWNPDKLSLIEKEFLKSEEIGMVYADASVVDENLETKNITMWQCINFDENKQKDFRNNKALDNLLRDGCVLGSSMAFRTKFNELILPIPLDTYFIHDNWIALVISAVSQVSIIEKPLIKYRQHQNQSSSGMQIENESDIKDALNASQRINNFDSVIRQLEILEKRLLKKKDISQNTIKKINAAQFHLKARANLPDNFFSRLKKVYSEYKNGNYNNYSNGIKSAIKDTASGKTKG